MRGHQQAAGPRLQKLLEPDDRFDVEVVRRLVHQQDVGLAEQHARHRHAHLPSARQRPHIAVNPLVVESEPVQDLARAALERVAAEVLVLFLNDAEALERRVQRIGLRGVGHRVLKLFELVMQRAEPAAAGNRFVEHRAARHLFDVLTEIADRHSFGNRHFPFVRALFPDNHPEERRLAGAVRPDEADLLAFVQLERGVDEQHLLAVLLADFRERNHARRAAAIRRAARRSGAGARNSRAPIAS